LIKQASIPLALKHPLDLSSKAIKVTNGVIPGKVKQVMKTIDSTTRWHNSKRITESAVISS
jgi:hypothetical protein